MENYQFIHREQPEHINKNLNDMRRNNYDNYQIL
jgi:hypothetical protein